jgi:hypothetical protein
MVIDPITPSLQERLDAILAEFVEKQWERHTTVLPHATPAPFTSENELFEALVNADRKGRLDESSQCVVWIDRKLQADPRDYAARSSDRSLRGYLARLADQTGDKEFTVLVPNPHRHDARLRNLVSTFARKLAAHSGIPCGGFDSGIFLGRYSKTPFGVHRGQMSVLTFPILGAKRFLLWPHSYGDYHIDIQDTLNYDHHRATAISLTAEPGDIGYWPADYWHIADGPVAISAALNIGLWWDQPHLDYTLRVFGEALAEHHTESGIDHACFHAGSNLDPGLQKSMGLIEAVARSKKTLAALELRWLAMRSASGMRDPYPIRRIEREESAPQILVRLTEGETIMSAELADGRIGIALLGHAIGLERDDAVSNDIALLNQGGVIGIDLTLIAEEMPHNHSRFLRFVASNIAAEMVTRAEQLHR